MRLFCDFAFKCQYKVGVVFRIGRHYDAFVDVTCRSVVGIKCRVDIPFLARQYGAFGIISDGASTTGLDTCDIQRIFTCVLGCIFQFDELPFLDSPKILHGVDKLHLRE